MYSRNRSSLIIQVQVGQVFPSFVFARKGSVNPCTRHHHCHALDVLAQNIHAIWACPSALYGNPQGSPTRPRPHTTMLWLLRMPFTDFGLENRPVGAAWRTPGTSQMRRRGLDDPKMYKWRALRSVCRWHILYGRRNPNCPPRLAFHCNKVGIGIFRRLCEWPIFLKNCEDNDIYWHVHCHSTGLKRW